MKRYLWKGHDPRNIRMVLREADVAWCSAEDLLGLNLDVASLQAALRLNAALVLSAAQDSARATGRSGEVVARALATRHATARSLRRALSIGVGGEGAPGLSRIW